MAQPSFAECVVIINNFPLPLRLCEKSNVSETFAAVDVGFYVNSLLWNVNSHCGKLIALNSLLECCRKLIPKKASLNLFFYYSERMLNVTYAPSCRRILLFVHHHYHVSKFNEGLIFGRS